MDTSKGKRLTCTIDEMTDGPASGMWRLTATGGGGFVWECSYWLTRADAVDRAHTVLDCGWRKSAPAEEPVAPAPGDDGADIGPATVLIGITRGSKHTIRTARETRTYAVVWQCTDRHGETAMIEHSRYPTLAGADARAAMIVDDLIESGLYRRA